MTTQVRFTATVFNPDTEETFNGWVDPQWSMWELRSTADDVRAFTFDDDVEAREFVRSEIGDFDSFDGVSWYAADSKMNNDTGEDWSYAAHFTEL